MHLGHPLPCLEELVISWGGEEFLNIIVNARSFSYSINTFLDSFFEKGEITTNQYLKSRLEFSIGFDQMWVCRLEWNVKSYLLHLRPLPTTRSRHKIHAGYHSSIFSVENGILSVTGLIISF